MLEQLTSFLTVLPFGTAMSVAAIGFAPTYVQLFRSSTTMTTKMQVVVCVGGAIGSWATLNALIPFLSQ